MKHVVLYCEPDCHVAHSFVLKEITGGQFGSMNHYIWSIWQYLFILTWS